MACSLLNFVYYVQFQKHTDKTLVAMQDSLALFHAHKGILTDLGICKHFNVLKIHLLLYYVSSIQALGSADGYNTEHPECLHIDYTKDAYRSSNKQDYVEQMELWLQCQEVIHYKNAYHTWKALRKSASLEGRVGDSEAGSDIGNEGAGEDTDQLGVQ